MIEDYASAFVERAQDQAVLAKADRRIAAMHMGGIVIECRLKADYQSSFQTSPRRTHDLLALAIGLNDLAEQQHLARPKFDEETIELIQKINAPLDRPFIHLRYLGISPTDQDYMQWKVDFRTLQKRLNRILGITP
ncbi:hypothetical protein H6G52_11865 [Limnothrix sp. FACHB-881]|uniref:hypothetical protein n=1 Tax=Limnothrix sp. FACHB-881 TaxID=2692819 RepID=UPI001687BD23|nr:hypothetical protein [Limnothrix sp. FACHB-881]MBD2636058.1 hypothetical protein [Limnothrix sp. FACHB-881]